MESIDKTNRKKALEWAIKRWRNTSNNYINMEFSGNAEDVIFVVLDRVAKVIADGNGIARIAEKYIEVEENDGT